MRKQIFETLRLEKIVGGGQAIGTLDDGRKAFVWGGLPKELVTDSRDKEKITLRRRNSDGNYREKSRANYAEG